MEFNITYEIKGKRRKDLLKAVSDYVELTLLSFIYHNYVRKIHIMKGLRMNKYELAVVINGRLSKIESDQVLEKIKQLIDEAQGVDINVDDWGKRRLAYEIQKMREGYYYFVSFKANDDIPAEIERKIRIIEDVLRFLIVKSE